jgi:hypothetical protein
MNSLSEIKQKLAEEKGYPDWDSYASIAPISSTDELARKCFIHGLIEVGRQIRKGASLNEIRQFIIDSNTILND